jgi:phosphatidylethanolamine-binding protein (PEBP) family uncharacterized protein
VVTALAHGDSIILYGVAEFALQSTAFEHGEPIPRRHSCQGEGLSPSPAWSGAPERTLSLVLVVDGPDAPSRTFTHWLGWALDPGVPGLSEGEAAPVEGRNDFGTSGYRGAVSAARPRPQPLLLPALRARLRPRSATRRRQALVRARAGGDTLAVAELTGTYER